MNVAKQNSAFALALIANILWASSFVGSKYTLIAWGPYTSVFLRFAFSFIVLLTAYKILKIDVRPPSTKRQWSMVLLVGVILGALYPLQLSGLQYIDTSVSAAIMLLSPIILVFLGPLITKEVLDRNKAIAVILGAVGGVILVSANFHGKNLNNSGLLLTLGAAFCLALYTLANKQASSSIRHTTVTLYSFAIGSVMLAPLSYFEPSRAVASSTDLYNSAWALLYLVVCCTAIPFFIWNRATAMTDTKNLASTMHLKTPVAIILGVIIFGEPMTQQLVLGTAIVSFALWLSQKSRMNLNLKNNIKGVKIYEREPIGSAAITKIH